MTHDSQDPLPLTPDKCNNDSYLTILTLMGTNIKCSKITKFNYTRTGWGRGSLQLHMSRRFSPLLIVSGWWVNIVWRCFQKKKKKKSIFCVNRNMVFKRELVLWYSGYQTAFALFYECWASDIQRHWKSEDYSRRAKRIIKDLVNSVIQK